MHPVETIYAELPFDGPAVCADCAAMRTDLPVDLVVRPELRRMVRAGLVAGSRGPCEDCGRRAATGVQPTFFTAAKDPPPQPDGPAPSHLCHRLLDGLRQTAGYLCRSCVGRHGNPAENVDGGLAALERTGHARRTESRCSRCGRRSVVWQANPGSEIRRQLGRKVLLLVPASLGSAVGAALFVVAALLLDRHLWPHSSFVVSLLAFPWLTWLIWATFFANRGSADGAGPRYVFHPTGASAHIFFGPPLYLAAFFFVSRGLWTFLGEGFFHVAGAAGDATWLLYVLDNFVRAALFDAAEIYGWSLSPVTHAGNPLAASLVFLFRLTLGLGLLEMIFRGARIFRSPHWKVPAPPA